jgi:hypothetical protein
MYLRGGVGVDRLLILILLVAKHFGLSLHQLLPSTNRLKFFSFAAGAAEDGQGSRLLRFRFNVDPFLEPRLSVQKAPSPASGCLRLFFIPLLLALCVMPLSAAIAASVDLEWDPNSDPELAGYKIYWGTSSGTYTSSRDVGKTTTATIKGIDEGKTYYFVATAYDSQNNESDFSNQVSFTIPFSDTDGDGVADYQDAFPSDPSETTDSDGDGIGNNADKDDDNDNMPDSWEIQYGFDPLVDDASQDSDGDGLSNLDEYLAGSDPMVPQDNSEPDTPTLSAPDDQRVVELIPVLKTSNFNDPDAGDFHSATRWRIFGESDDVCVFDIISEYSLTELQVPKLILDENKGYRWQAMHYDNHGTPSAWSSSRFFTTQTDAEDNNNNGIPDNQEVETPVDLDGDGTWDADQNDIKCVKAGNGKSLGISFEGSSNVVEIESIKAEPADDNPVLSAAPSNSEQFPFGLINFKLIVNQPGDPAEVKIYFSEPAPADGCWFKYDPIEATWTDYSSQTVFSSDRRSLTLYLEDGGEGDADGSANGIIVDPSGVAVSSFASGSGSGGGIRDMAGCFINSVSVKSVGFNVARVWKAVRGRELAFGLLLLAMIKILTIVLGRMRQRWEETQRRFETYHERGGRFTARHLTNKG